MIEYNIGNYTVKIEHVKRQAKGPEIIATAGRIDIKLGSPKPERTPAELEVELYEHFRGHDKTVSFFHEIGELPNGMRYGRLGAMTYLIDESNRIITPGFHHIKPATEPNKYSTSLGNREFRLEVKTLEQHL